MSKYSRDIDLLHPLLRDHVTQIAAEVKEKLAADLAVKPISIHRTPQEQFEIFRNGRIFSNDRWIVKNKSLIHTNKDGFEMLSMHNHLPALAVDFGLMHTAAGVETYLGNSQAYKQIGPVVEGMGFEWGGRWSSPYDPGHVQVSINRLAFQNIERGVAAVWQDMLKATGHYAGKLDGYFGQKSSDALAVCTGSALRTPKSYKKLLAKYRALP